LDEVVDCLEEKSEHVLLSQAIVHYDLKEEEVQKYEQEESEQQQVVDIAESQELKEERNQGKNNYRDYKE
jgi:hypothetical protein